MKQSVKRSISIAAIVVASVVAGILISADLGWITRSKAQPQQQLPPGRRIDPGAVASLPSFADLAEQAMPAVVSITVKEIVRAPSRRGVDPFDFFFPDPHRRPMPQQPDEERQRESGGSGFIISPDGYIVTNNHVIEGATTVEVRIGQAERVYEAKIVGRDPATDLAVIKVEPEQPLPTLALGRSADVRVGDWAIAIGNPLQFQNTLTVGVISGKGRSLGISEATFSFESFLQTDAAINFGNSGGPLLNARGEVIGVNTAIRAMAQNIGFAVPIDTVKLIYPQLRERGRVVRSYLGVNIQEVDARIQQAFNLPEAKGVLVQAVEPDTPAARAGIEPGDVILEVDGREIDTTRELIDYISYLEPGTRVNVTLFRDGRRRNATVVTAERPPVEGMEEREEAEESPARSRIGIAVQPINQNARQMYGIPETVRSGVVVTDVRGVSPAADAGLAVGDVITRANGRTIESPEDLRKVIDAADPGSFMRVYVTRFARGGRQQSFFAIIEIPR